jgi:Asp-tRNA(Asn)/Glu-tRNA(Gln) amidotransferase C subunit
MPITEQGIGQPDLDTFLRAVATLGNELRTDRDTSGNSYEALLAKLDADGLTDSNYATVLSIGGTGAGWPANPVAAALVATGFTSIDMSQLQLSDYMDAISALANELRTDRATMTLSYEALLAKLDADGTVNDTDYVAVLKIGGTGDAWPANPAGAAIDTTLITPQGVGQPDLFTAIAATQTLLNELRTDRTGLASGYKGLLTKLDADSGVTDTDYFAVLKIGGTGDAWPANPAAAALDLSA